MQIRSLDGEDPLEKGMATHSSILAWGIPWTEEPIRLQIPWREEPGGRFDLLHFLQQVVTLRLPITQFSHLLPPHSLQPFCGAAALKHMHSICKTDNQWEVAA